MLKIKLLLAMAVAGLFSAVSCSAQNGAAPVKGTSLNVDDRTYYVNVMGEAMPSALQFPAVSKKPGFVRGYVKNSQGEPILGQN